MGLRDEQMAFTADVILLLQKANELGFEVTLGEVFRPIEMQRIYYQTGRSKTMKSPHMDKLAIDLNLFRSGVVCTHKQILPLGTWWESLNSFNRWGGSWRGLIASGKSTFIDAPHFERKPS